MDDKNMEELLNRLMEQEKKSRNLELQYEERRNLLQNAEQFIHHYIESLPSAKAFIEKPVELEKLQLGGKKKEISELLKVFESEVTEKGLRAASGGHVGYIPGGGIFTAALGDLLAAISNEYAGVSYASPGAVAIENAVLDWLKSLFSFPESAVGNLASGGSISNLIALTAARDCYQVKNEKIPKSVIYLSKHAHHCIKKSLRIIGLEDVCIRHLPLDAHFKIIPEALKQQIEEDRTAGLNPFLVIASAGTTDVGAIDPLESIAAIAKEHHLWFHVDAAYGGFFILSSKKHLFQGIEQADSIVVDPHKGLFLPYGLGAVLVKNAKAVLHSNLYTAAYMQDATQETLTWDPANVSPELTKHFRGLRLWLPLQLHGIEPFQACLEEKLLLTEYFREQLHLLGFELGPQPDLSVSFFWYPFENNKNELNRLLMKEIHEDGTVFLSSTLIEENFVIRMAILSFRTHKKTIDKAIEMIQRCLKKVQEKNQNHL